MDNETYEVKVTCSNCNFGRHGSITVKIPSGQKVADTPCPECGCKTLRVK